MAKLGILSIRTNVVPEPDYENFELLPGFGNFTHKLAKSRGLTRKEMVDLMYPGHDLEVYEDGKDKDGDNFMGMFDGSTDGDVEDLPEGAISYGGARTVQPSGSSFIDTSEMTALED